MIRTVFHFFNAVPFPPLILIFAYVLDLVFGDPEGFPHPVRWIGRLISALEKTIRRFFSVPKNEKAGGVLLAVVTVGITYSISLTILYFAYKISLIIFYLIATYMVWTSISIKSLGKEAKSVIKALNENGIEEARKRLSRIVGRDTGKLGREGVLKAVVETVSENTSDGIVAPLFYLIIGGPALMMAYKAVNTLDSMVGYKNERYLSFGWFSARLDDAANYIPARLTSFLIITASFILGYNWMRSFRILLRDGRNHPSPNSGLPEAAVAGALGLKLGGPMSYGGIICEKPSIGDAVMEADNASAISSIRIMRLSSFFMIALALFARTVAVFVS